MMSDMTTEPLDLAAEQRTANLIAAANAVWPSYKQTNLLELTESQLNRGYSGARLARDLLADALARLGHELPGPPA
jgi:hypothetical protein